jgi:ABC-type sugar transport system ATPase subunit
MVFQNYALYPHFTVFENIAFPLRARRLAAAAVEPRVRQAAGRLGLEALLDRKPGQLSGGQQQRVALARAIVRNPVVYLMDEPLSNLDAQLRVQTRTELKRLQHELGTTTLYVTHDQAEAMTMGARVALLRQGAVEQVGPPLELYRRPANVFVAGFLGSPAMNLWPARLEAGALHLAGGAIALPAERMQALPAELTVGLRPEDVAVAPADAGEGDGAARVLVVEPMGSETVVTLERQGARIVARVGGDLALAPGQLARLTLAAERLHFFDAGSGRRMAIDNRHAGA